MLDDKTHMESLAASLYFKELLKGHSRQNKNYYYNKLLNYGYKIFRSMIAQELTVSGFICSIGLFHRNELNNYNLADDIIEPYRPFVDYYVFTQFNEEKSDLATEDKSRLLKLPETEVQNQKKEYLTISLLVKKSVQSLKEASDKKDNKLLFFPDFQPMKERTYE